MKIWQVVVSLKRKEAATDSLRVTSLLSIPDHGLEPPGESHQERGGAAIDCTLASILTESPVQTLWIQQARRQQGGSIHQSQVLGGLSL